MIKDGEKCYRCSETVLTGLPKAGWEGASRFSATMTRVVYRIRFNYVRLRGWRDAPKAADVLESVTYTDATLCDRCWGDVLNFICTTKPET